jgi:hypothetical protein
MKKDSKKLYFDLVEEKKYDLAKTEEKFTKLDFDSTKFDSFHLKSAIVYLSRFEDEIDRLIIEANKNVMSILNAATVKEERG